MNKIRFNEALLSLAFLAIIFSVALPGFIRSDKIRNERTACAALDAIVSAEEEFYREDLDRNGIQDYWARDIGGLQVITKNHISEKLARADRTPSEKYSYLYQDRNPEAYSGYWFQAVRAKTDRSGFRYAALPSRYGEAGEHVFLIDESRKLIRRDYSEDVLEEGIPPRLNKIWEGKWPSQKERSELWTEIP